MLKFSNLLVAMCLTIFISCVDQNEECITTCFNNGVCIDGNCECPDGFETTDCSSPCKLRIFGTWEVIETKPEKCTVLYYIFSENSGNNLTVSIDDGVGILRGLGRLSADCSELTYAVARGGRKKSGEIIYNGNILSDRSEEGCVITARKKE